MSWGRTDCKDGGGRGGGEVGGGGRGGRGRVRRRVEEGGETGGWIPVKMLLSRSQAIRRWGLREFLK